MLKQTKGFCFLHKFYEWVYYDKAFSVFILWENLSLKQSSDRNWLKAEIHVGITAQDKFKRLKQHPAKWLISPTKTVDSTLLMSASPREEKQSAAVLLNVCSNMVWVVHLGGEALNRLWRFNAHIWPDPLNCPCKATECVLELGRSIYLPVQHSTHFMLNYKFLILMWHGPVFHF